MLLAGEPIDAHTAADWAGESSGSGKQVAHGDA
jgi:hypothetical protein